MCKLVLAIDCDDVLLPSTERIVAVYNDMYQTVIDLEYAHASAYTGWGTDRHTVHERIRDIQLSSEYADTPPFEDAIAVVRRLANTHELHLVTARAEVIMDVTYAMVEAYFEGCFTTIEHIGLDGSKGEVCSRIKADLLIDDNLKHLLDATSHGIGDGLWFGNYQWQTNESHEAIIRCANWNSVEREVYSIASR